MKTIKMNVQGCVQGVAFRYTTKMKADEQKVYGYAKNLEDGSVEVVLQGNEEEVDNLATIVQRCPSPAGFVTSYTKEVISNEPQYTRFSVL